MFTLRTTLIAAAAAGFSLFSATTAIADTQSDAAPIPEIEWNETLVKFQFDKDKFIGQRFSGKCMPARAKDMKSTVYGTDVYPSDNSICKAALHAGKISKDGGVITVQLNPGASEYRGSKRNGIESKNGSGGIRTISFVDRSVRS